MKCVQLALGRFRLSIDKHFIFAHPLPIPSKCLCGFFAIQLLSQPFTTTTMLLLFNLLEQGNQKRSAGDKKCGLQC